MRKLTTDDYLSCAFFAVIGCIFLGLAYMANINDSAILAIVMLFIACCGFCAALWSLSDFKTWK